MEAIGGGEYSSYSFTTSALYGGEWSASHLIVIVLPLLLLLLIIIIIIISDFSAFSAMFYTNSDAILIF
jgi:hypothetical protein